MNDDEHLVVFPFIMVESAGMDTTLRGLLWDFFNTLTPPKIVFWYSNGSSRVRDLNVQMINRNVLDFKNIYFSDWVAGEHLVKFYE